MLKPNILTGFNSNYFLSSDFYANLDIAQPSGLTLIHSALKLELDLDPFVQQLEGMAEARMGYVKDRVKDEPFNKWLENIIQVSSEESVRHVKPAWNKSISNTQVKLDLLEKRLSNHLGQALTKKQEIAKKDLLVHLQRIQLVSSLFLQENGDRYFCLYRSTSYMAVQYSVELVKSLAGQRFVKK